MTQSTTTWPHVPLSEAVEFLDGQRRPVKKADRVHMRGKFPYFGASGVIDYVNDYLFDEDLILLGEDGENILSRRLPLAFKITGRTWVNNHAHVLRPKPGFDIDYLAVYLESLDYSILNSGTAQPKLNKKSCMEVRVIAPPLQAQQHVSTALTDSDKLITRLERLIAKRQAIKQGIMQQLLTGKIRLPGFEEPWNQRAIGDVAAVDPEALGAAVSPNRVIDYISLEDVSHGVLVGSSRVRFGDAPSRARRIIRETDVLFGTVRPNLQSHAIYSGGLTRPIASTGFAVIRALPATADARFLFSLLMSSLASNQIDRIIAGSNYPAVSSGDVGRLTFEFPSVCEQSAIGAVLADCDAGVSELRNRLTKAEAVRQGMMQELLTGRTRLLVEEGAA